MRRPALVVAEALVVSAVLVACGAPQFGVRNEPNVAAASASTAPVSASATTTAATTATAPTPSSSASDAPPTSSAAPSSTTSAKIPPRKTIIARHILIQWMGCRAADANIVRTKEQARAVAIDVLRRLKAGEEFTRLVLDYSDEPNAGRRGGSLPPFGHGTMDKAFEAAAFSLAPGELSGVVETQFGYHVIQRLE